MHVEVRELTRRFGRFTALDGVSLQVPAGQLVALLGPSGSGKTTLLRVIAGLERTDSGRVLFDGEDATDRDVGSRRVGFVFQHYALFRHMSVFDNVAFGLRVRGHGERPSAQAIRRRVGELLALVQLDGLERRLPAQLSGGQRQRVAVARALAIDPRVLLLDERFGALDSRVRQELRRGLRRLHDELGLTGVLVTHDQEEALEVADRIVVMNQGRIEQVGTPTEVYEQPATPFVYEFLGNANHFRGRVQQGRFHTGAVALEARAPEAPVALGYARPHDLALARQATDTTAIAAVVGGVRPLGPIVRVEVRRDDTGESLDAELPQDAYRALGLTAGERVYVTVRNLRVFAAEG